MNPTVIRFPPSARFNPPKCFDCGCEVHDNDDAHVCIECGGCNRRLNPEDSDPPWQGPAEVTLYVFLLLIVVAGFYYGGVGR